MIINNLNRFIIYSTKYIKYNSVIKGKMNMTTTTASQKITTTGATNSTEIDNKNNLIAICLMRSTNDKKSNQLQVREIVQKSKLKNASFVFLPELCDFVGTNRKETLELAEPITGDNVKFYKNLAKEFNVWLSIGGVHEAFLYDTNNIENQKKSDKIQITHLIIDNSGEIKSRYCKIHLFDIETEEFKFKESALVAGGNKIIPPIPTPIGRLGQMICYDVRFPELSTLLTRTGGAEILTYPSAFAYETGKAHWETLLRARAIENQCFVIASAQVGFHNKKRQSYGNAMVINPWGDIIAHCKNNRVLDIAICSIDLSELERVRKNMPCLKHRRDDIYSLYTIGDQLNAVEVDDYNNNKFEEKFLFEMHEIPADTIFYQTSKSVAFTNIRCVLPGHVLVASRRQLNRLKDLTEDEITDFFQTVCKVQKLIEHYYNVASSTITVQDGTDAGQTVKHVHCHIMPRRPGDFKFNDEIYIELQKHDANNRDDIDSDVGNVDDSNKQKQLPRRHLDEMIKEAQEYRNLLLTLKNNDSC